MPDAIITALVQNLRGQNVQNPAFVKVAEILELLNAGSGGGGGSDSPAGDVVEYDTADPIHAQYLVPAGYEISRIIPFYASSGTMIISDIEEGGDDIVTEIEIDAGWNQPIFIYRFYPTGGTIYIDGIPTGSKIVYLIQKIKMANT